MKHPPYHLRPNKAVDRFLLIEVLRLLGRECDFRNYTYYGFGGPFLEDCRLINEFFPDMRLVSIEQDENTFRRQKFHKFTKKLVLKDDDFSNFLGEFSSTGKEVFWLDYTSLRLEWLNEFGAVLNAAGNGTVVKITLSAEWRTNPYSIKGYLTQDEFETKLAVYRTKFKNVFGKYLPQDLEDSDFKNSAFPKLLQSVIQLAAQEALPAASGNIFQVINTAWYSDGTAMLSVTGIVCSLAEANRYRMCFEGWTFSNLDWQKPKKIQLPVLSNKERLLLEKHLPVRKNTGKSLARTLGYLIDRSECNIESLQQYAAFYRYYPNYAKVTP